MAEQQVDINTMTVEQLEALAYRLVKQLQLIQQNLAVVERRIAQLAQANNDSVTNPQP